MRIRSLRQEWLSPTAKSPWVGGAKVKRERDESRGV